MVEPADPRPVLDGSHVRGSRCQRCGHGFSPAGDWCPRCLSAADPAVFGPAGTVWSSTVVHLPVGNRRPPWAVAYVDLDDGPRVLGCLDQPVAAPPGARVELAGADDGDPVFRLVEAGQS